MKRIVSFLIMKYTEKELINHLTIIHDNNNCNICSSLANDIDNYCIFCKKYYVNLDKHYKCFHKQSNNNMKVLFKALGYRKKEYKCHLCNKIFKRRGYLTLHIKGH